MSRDTAQRPQPLILLCAGFPRSGSTWLFNVMRIALRRAQVPLHAAWVNDYDADHPAPVHLVKVHDRSPLLNAASAVFVSTRDLRDVAASQRLHDPDSDNPERVVDHFHERLSHHGAYERAAHHHVVYEEMVRDKQGHIAQVLAKLGIDGDPQAIHLEVESLQVRDRSSDGRYDTTNLLLVGHVRHGGTGYYRDVLSAESTRAIERHFSAWLQDHGYDVAKAAAAEQTPSARGACPIARPEPKRPSLIQLTEAELLARMIRDDERGLIYYWTPKCGCVNFLANIFRSMGKLPADLAAAPGLHLPQAVAELRVEHQQRLPVTAAHLQSSRYRKVKLVRSPYRRIASAYFMLRRQHEAIRQHARSDARYREKLLYFPDLDFGTFLSCLHAPYTETVFTRQVRYHCSRMSAPALDRHFETVRLEESAPWFEGFDREHFADDGFRFDFEGVGQILKRQEHHNPAEQTALDYDALYEDSATLADFHELFADDVIQHGYAMRTPAMVSEGQRP
ncbi:MAG: sulfotransferase family 2 domain-containing protein [Planctomycetota bacterium]